MGTHPIFESDFDCLTDMETAVEINETEFVANYSQSLSDAQLVSQPSDHGQSSPSTSGSDSQMTTSQESESDNESSPKIPRLEENGETDQSEAPDEQNASPTETVPDISLLPPEIWARIFSMLEDSCKSMESFGSTCKYFNQISRDHFCGDNTIRNTTHRHIAI